MTHEFNNKGICTKCGCSRTAVRAFNFPCKQGAADADSAPLKRPSQASAMTPVSMKVFISHSHRDRELATDLQATLSRYGAQTYLDQDQMQAGDVLPDRIRQGVEWCETFLLIWSASAATSTWVSHEWNLAYELRRRIIPYVLDRTPLPSGLNNLVYVDIADRELNDAKLLTAVFGPDFLPDPTTLFPGRWSASIDAYGVAKGTYSLNLRANGQIEGESGFDQSSPLARLLEQVGMGSVATMCVPVHGTWSYDRNTQSLILVISVSALGQQSTETVTIQTNGREKKAITGKDFQGRLWKLHRE